MPPSGTSGVSIFEGGSQGGARTRTAPPARNIDFTFRSGGAATGAKSVREHRKAPRAASSRWQCPVPLAWRSKRDNAADGRSGTGW